MTNVLLGANKWHDSWSMLSIDHGVVASARVGERADNAGGWSRFRVNQGAAASFIDGRADVNDEVNGVVEIK